MRHRADDKRRHQRGRPRQKHKRHHRHERAAAVLNVALTADRHGFGTLSPTVPVPHAPASSANFPAAPPTAPAIIFDSSARTPSTGKTIHLLAFLFGLRLDLHSARAPSPPRTPRARISSPGTRRCPSTAPTRWPSRPLSNRTGRPRSSRPPRAHHAERRAESVVDPKIAWPISRLPSRATFRPRISPSFRCAGGPGLR